MPVDSWPPVLAASVLATACAGPPTASLAWQDAWEAVVAGHDGTVLLVRVAQGNTGLLRGQARIEVDALPPSGTPVRVRRRAPPSGVTVDARARVTGLAADRVTWGEGTWEATLREGADILDATVHLAARAEAVPPTVLDEGRRQRSVGAPMPLADAAGAWRSGALGGVLDGRAVLVREAGDGWPDGRTPRESLYLMGRDRSVGVEILGDRALAWSANASGVRVGRTARQDRRGRRLEVSLGPDLDVTATVRLDREVLTTGPWADLSVLERPLASLVAGRPVRVLERGGAVVREAGVEPWTAAAVHVVRAGTSGHP